MKENCIDIARLVEYSEGRLTGKALEAMEKHLCECDACLEEFIMANRLMADEELKQWDPLSESGARALWQTLKKRAAGTYEWIKARLPLSPASPFQPAFASVVRSGAGPAVDFIHLNREFEDLEADMVVQKGDDQKIDIHVGVTRGHQVPGNVRLTFIKGDEILHSRLLEQGRQVIDGLDFGKYEMLVIDDAVEKGRIRFDIHEAGLDAT